MEKKKRRNLCFGMVSHRVLSGEKLKWPWFFFRSYSIVRSFVFTFDCWLLRLCVRIRFCWRIQPNGTVSIFMCKQAYTSYTMRTRVSVLIRFFFSSFVCSLLSGECNNCKLEAVIKWIFRYFVLAAYSARGTTHCAHRCVVMYFY